MSIRGLECNQFARMPSAAVMRSDLQSLAPTPFAGLEERGITGRGLTSQTSLSSAHRAHPANQAFLHLRSASKSLKSPPTVARPVMQLSPIAVIVASSECSQVSLALDASSFGSSQNDASATHLILVKACCPQTPAQLRLGLHL